MEAGTRQQKVPVYIEDEMRQSYVDYAMSVIVGRALPDVRDGLKPVHRRVLFAMHDMGNHWNNPYRKSARVVGDVIGKYHPHGDAAAYDAIVRLAQDFSMRYCLVDGQGNFGSIDGDPPAAMRYTEIRMARIAQELLSDIDKETVDFLPNYDDSLEEPSVLPSRLPNLLINGASGIAVGMATNIPPHNLSEVIDGLIALVERPELTIDELMEYIPGPDFPTGGFIHGREGISQGYKTGRGSVQMRARVSTETVKRTGKEQIIISEIPYMVNKTRLLEQIANLVNDKKIEGIADLRDESDRDGMRIVVEPKRDAVPQIVINALYKHTSLQESFGVNMLAIIEGRPKLLNLKEILEAFLEHRRETVTRRTAYDLRKAEERLHILEGLKIALDYLDEVIKLIRESPDPRSAKEGLMAGAFARDSGGWLPTPASSFRRPRRRPYWRCACNGSRDSNATRSSRSIGPSRPPSWSCEEFSPTSRRSTPSSWTSSGTSRRPTATGAAPPSSTRPRRFPSRTSSWRRTWWSPCPTRGTSSAIRSRSTARRTAAARARWAPPPGTRTSSSPCSSPPPTPTSCSSPPSARSIASRSTRCRRPAAPPRAGRW